MPLFCGCKFIFCCLNIVIKLLFRFLPESFHFLVGKNRHREAKAWVNKCNVEKLNFPDDNSRICRPIKSHEGESFYTQ